MAPSIELLIKPTGADCNLACDYCFYLEKASLYPGSARRMSPETLDALVRTYLALPQPAHAFCWQGGEPLLLGRKFFEAVTDSQGRHASPGSVVTNSVQTNAVLVDDGIARHFADHRFLVGCSLDGPPEIHDRFRRGRDGEGSHAAAMRGIDTLRRHGVAVNVLTLVSRANADRAEETYRYLRSQGFNHLQFIPCVEGPAEMVLDGETWGEFLCELFDAWWPQDVGHVAIRTFEAVAAKLAYGLDLLCTMAGDCRQYLVIEHNGDVYPCDFYVEPGWLLGNVRRDSLAALRDDPRRRYFGATKSAVPSACTTCEHWELCRGDCPRRRPGEGVSSLCAGWSRFYSHVTPRCRELARLAQLRDGASGAAGR